MEVLIHFLAGDDLSIQSHYDQKGYREDVVIEIDRLFYEVYFFLDDMANEIRDDGFFSYPGLIILDEIKYDKIYNAINKLIDLNYFDYFAGKEEMPINNRFIDTWRTAWPPFTLEDLRTYKLR